MRTHERKTEGKPPGASRTRCVGVAVVAMAAWTCAWVVGSAAGATQPAQPLAAVAQVDGADYPIALPNYCPPSGVADSACSAEFIIPRPLPAVPVAPGDRVLVTFSLPVQVTSTQLGVGGYVSSGPSSGTIVVPRLSSTDYISIDFGVSGPAGGSAGWGTLFFSLVPAVSDFTLRPAEHWRLLRGSILVRRAGALSITLHYAHGRRAVAVSRRRVSSGVQAITVRLPPGAKPVTASAELQTRGGPPDTLRAVLAR